MVQLQKGLCVGTLLLQVVRVFGALKCLGCVDVSDPSLCRHVKHCQSGEVCVTEKFQQADGQVIFNLGCRNGATCSSQNTATTGQPAVGNTCTDCCNSDLCNSVGCGTKGYNSTTDGPVCYNCPHSNDLSTCEEIKVCRKDESCYIQEENTHFFATRCIQKALCNVGGGPNPVGRRWISNKRDARCTHCCDGNLCNDVCNQDGIYTTSSTTPTTIATTALTTSGTTPGQVCRDSRDTEFIVMFIPNTNHDTETIQLVFTSFTGQSKIEMTSSLKGVSKNISLSRQALPVNVSKDLVHVNNSLILNKGVYIKASEPISVHGFSTFGLYGSSGAFTALPVNMLGTDYIAITYPSGISQIGIVATSDNTDITVIFNTTKAGKVDFNDQVYRNGDKATFSLNRLDTVRIKTYGFFSGDLTGTTIQSNKPIGVMSGDTCMAIGLGYCDYAVSMLPPVNRWGTSFIIPRINPEMVMVLRIVPSVENTIIELENNGTQTSYTTNKTIEVRTPVDVLTFVSCSHPCLVVQYSSPDKMLDPFMAIVPPQEQFLNRYAMGVSTLQNYSNHVSISIESKDVNGLQYNGKQLSGNLLTALDRNNTEWTSITMELKGYVSHVINHTSRDVYFGVTQYGYKAYETFAFPVAYGDKYSRDTEFIFMFIPNTHHDVETIQLVFTSFTGHSAIEMTSSLQGISKNISLSSRTLPVNISSNIVHVNNSLILNKGLHIKSTEPISVHGYSTYGPYGSSGAFTALPVNMLGTDYVAVTYPTGTSQIGIVATSDNTNITVVFNTTKTGKIDFNDQIYRNGDRATFVLNRLDTVRIKAFDEDLTGTTIHSNNPIGVMSGDECAGINRYGYCDFIVSMVPPVNRWGKSFIIPRINSEKIMILRIVPSVENTIVELENNGTQTTFVANKTVEVSTPIDVLTFVSCSKPCLVVQYSSPDREFDPFMAIVPPQEQFSNRYVMGVSTLQNYRNHVSISIESQDVNGLQYNGKQLSGNLLTALDRNNTEWTSITMELKGHGSDIINHMSSGVYFGVTQYGYKDYEAFAFPVAYGNSC